MVGKSWMAGRSWIDSGSEFDGALSQTILASCFVLFAWRVLRPAFGSLSVVFSPLNAFPAKYVSYTFTTPSLNFEVRTSSVSVE